jgi:hypothetical protein
LFRMDCRHAPMEVKVLPPFAPSPILAGFDSPVRLMRASGIVR